MHFFIKKLVTIYSSGISGKFAILFVWWLLWPGLMFVVGLIGESRLVPIGKSQSKAFWPGDFAFGVAFVALVGLHAKPSASWGYSPLFWVPLALAMFFVFLFVRKGDIANYPKRSGNSPTKLTHDIVGYFIIPTVLLGLGLPKLLSRHPFTDWQNWLVFLGAIAFYIFCVAYDAKKGFTPECVIARHPPDWRPIWRR